MIFRAIWPITNPSMSYADLCAQARRDLTLLYSRAKATPTAEGWFSIQPSRKVPGSGNTTESVLLFQCPATATGPRVHPHLTTALTSARRVDDVDEVMVERILSGDFTNSASATRPERTRIITAWPTTGRSMNDLERETGWKLDRYREDVA